jgi:hypothetical protein
MMPSVEFAKTENKRRNAILAKAKAASNRYPSHHKPLDVTAAAFTVPVQWRDVYHATVRGVRAAPSLNLKGEIALLSRWGAAETLPEEALLLAQNPYRFALTLHRILQTKLIETDDLRNILSLLTKLPRPAAAPGALDLSRPAEEPWVVETLRDAAAAPEAFNDPELQQRVEYVRQLDVEMAAVMGFGHACAQDWAYATVRVLHRLYALFGVPAEADIAPVLRQMSRIGFHADTATSVVHLLEEGVVSRDGFHVAIEACTRAGDTAAVRSLRNLYAVTFDLPIDEALPGLPASTAEALIESEQDHELRTNGLYSVDPTGTAMQTFNRAVHEGVFPHWHGTANPANAFVHNAPALTVSLESHTSPHAVATGVVYTLARVARAGAARATAEPAHADVVFKLPTAAGVAAKFAARAAAGEGYSPLAGQAALRHQVGAIVAHAPAELATLLKDAELVAKADLTLNKMKLALSDLLGKRGRGNNGDSAIEHGGQQRLRELESEFTALSQEIAAKTAVGASAKWNFASLVAAARARAAESGVSATVLDELEALTGSAKSKAPVSLISVLTATVPVDFSDAAHISTEAHALVDSFLRKVNKVASAEEELAHKARTAAEIARLNGDDGEAAAAAVYAAAKSTRPPPRPFSASYDRQLSVAQTLNAVAPLAPLSAAVSDVAEAISIVTGDVERFAGSTAIEQASKRAAVRVLEELELQHIVDADNGVLVLPKESVRAYIQNVKEAERAYARASEDAAAADQ